MFKKMAEQLANAMHDIVTQVPCRRDYHVTPIRIKFHRNISMDYFCHVLDMVSQSLKEADALYCSQHQVEESPVAWRHASYIAMAEQKCTLLHIQGYLDDGGTGICFFGKVRQLNNQQHLDNMLLVDCHLHRRKRGRRWLFTLYVHTGWHSDQLMLRWALENWHLMSRGRLPLVEQDGPIIADDD